MADISEIPYSSRPGGDSPPAAGKADAGGPALVAAAVFAAIVAGSAVLGLLAGLAWTAVAPHAVLVATGGGGADVVNPETSAFIVADGWFAVLCALGGAVCGLLGWSLAVRRHGVLAVLGLLGGGMAAALIARWAGQRSGQAAFTRQLAVSRPGALLRAPVSLGAHSAIAFWPLAAGLVVGGFEAIRLLRDRRLAAAGRPVPALAPAERARPEQADGW
jgi:hypothetical protein